MTSGAGVSVGKSNTRGRASAGGAGAASWAEAWRELGQPKGKGGRTGPWGGERGNWAGGFCWAGSPGVWAGFWFLVSFPFLLQTQLKSNLNSNKI